jgi:uncharacterized protein YecE (DUF72 family)
VAGRILVGVTGFHVGDFEEILYPRGTSPQDYLSLYAQEFLTVELTEGDLGQLGSEGVERCVKVTPAHFRFAVAQHLELEHSWERAVAELRTSIRPIVETGKLGAVVVELPNWFHYAPSSRKQLAALCDSMQDLPLAIVFNRGDWYRKQVVEGLRKRCVALVSVHTDSLSASSMPPHSEVTATFAYFRFMGRHVRYHLRRVNQYYEDCRYTPGELSSWAERISTIAKWADVYVLFQHHQDASDVYSSRLLRRFLGV